MMLVFLLFFTLIIVELVCWSGLLWKFRRVWAVPLALLISSVCIGLVFTIPLLFSISISFLGAYRIINVLRVYAGSTNPDFLHQVALTSAVWLCFLQSVVLEGFFILQALQVSLHASLMAGLLASQIAVGLMITYSTRRNIRTTFPPAQTPAYTDNELPALSVAIPARDETMDLQRCLESLVVSTYPKLEIVVLDDRSQEKRTPEIIRSFAHDGVKFVAGENPPRGWLAKNYAYHQLSEAINGELVFFCGVDTRFQPDTLTKMVTLLLAKQKTMISFMPKNNPENFGHIWPFLIQPARYAWELSLPRRILNRPPVLSTGWLIESELLKKSGGFKSIRHSNSPESHIANYAIHQTDGYSFIRDGGVLGFESRKSIVQQRATAVRTRYPQLHRRPELAALIGVSEIVYLFLPYLAAIYGVFSLNSLYLFSIVPAFLVSYSYFLTVQLTYQKRFLRGFLLHPVAVLYDVTLLNYSMLKYEFGTVVWKDRNAAEPIMRQY